MRRTLGSLATGLAGLLLITVLAGYAGHWSPAFEIASAFRLHLAMLAGATGLALGLVKLWRGAGLALLAALIAAAGLGPVLTSLQPPGTDAANSGHRLTVLYANLWDRNPEPQALAAALRAADADILITSETTGAVADGADGLRQYYPFRQVDPAGRSILRTTIWSKYPLLGGHLYPDNTVAPTAASVVAELGGGLRLGLIGAHFSRSSEGLRQVQADALGPMAGELRQGQLTRPLIIAGDFNAPPWSWLVSRAAEVTGTRVLGGHRITWKGTYPTPFGEVPALWGQQIDHMLLSSEIVVESVEILTLPGSDHRGLFVRLRIPRP